jgi:hypothetical protein
MMVLGVVLIGFSLVSMLAHYSPYPSFPLLVVAGAVLLVIGLLLLITELMETWLSRGQTALVDGLQAG